MGPSQMHSSMREVHDRRAMRESSLSQMRASSRGTLAPNDRKLEEAEGRGASRGSAFMPEWSEH